MNARKMRRQGKLLCYVLRHQPQKFGIDLDPAGWAEVHLLLEALQPHGGPVSRQDLLSVVAMDDKQRFACSEDGLSIRANQGQSVDVDLGYEPVVPPEMLFHGTVGRVIASINAEGLTKGRRHHVHLSETLETAARVGRRRGEPVVLEVASGAMAKDGHIFLKTPNGVWLTEQVPPEYLKSLPRVSNLERRR